ncbi:Pentatricopeptide repeat-containing protein [Symbiodinium microadriaticum]|uniref:Pentatricopeptide repeat-containing protein n=1 Tax=Symbiodinium microadriaticum TaxID=2951 RepID=A0A1Q9C4N9_SYMMI|nr:Pentatricopeptide repeat-containing protein [Symbiodinium microadriaticum]CAE7673755.1 EMB2745 [Symbiodinium sp. KB8]CAE7863957.1 EMB2745 [Symbiodinium microadriaticum]
MYLRHEVLKKPPLLRLLSREAKLHGTSDLAKLNELATQGEVTEAEAVFRQLEHVSYSWKPSSRRVLWNTMLKACANAGDSQAAEQLYQSMLSIRVEPNHKTFGKLIEAAAKSAQPQQAAIWLKEMLHCSFEPRLLNYNELISAAANGHDLDSAKSWLWHMGERRLQPNLVSYNSVLSAAAKKGDLHTCTAIYNTMQRSGVRPDAITFNTIISATARAESGITAAGEWLGIMKSATVAPGAETYNALLDVAAKHQDVQAAERFFRELVAEGWQPSVVSWRTLIAASTGSGEVHSARKALRAMSACKIQPNAVTYATLLRAEQRSSSHPCARKQMPEPSQEDAGIVMNILADAAAEAADVSGAEQVLLQFRMLGLQPDRFTYTAVIKACVVAGDVERAESHFASMMHEVQPDLAVFGLLLRSCLLMPLGMRQRKATRWFRLMCASRLSPSVLEYTQLLQALADEPATTTSRNQQHPVAACPQVGESHAFDEPIPDVEKVFREMLGKGVRPTRITIRVVEKVLGRRVVKRVLEELDVDEMLLGDLSAAYFQRRRALVAPRAQECERQKRRSYLRPTQTLAAADQKTSAHCRRAICRFAPPSKELVETRDSGQEDQNGTDEMHLQGWAAIWRRWGQRRLATLRLQLENPAHLPGERPFDLGPFACHRVPADAEPMRLDRWLQKHVCSNWNAGQKLISSRQVWVMSPNATAEQHRGSVVIPRFRPMCHGRTPLKANDLVYFPKVMSPVPKKRLPVQQKEETPGWLLRRIIYKDTDFLVLDKPSGWSVAPGKHVGGMHLLRLLPSLQFGMEEPPRLVHRLSTEMSGVLLLARHKAAASFAKDMVAQRSFWKRELWAVVCGRTPKSGQVSMPLALERLGKGSVAKPVREDDGGLPAMTEYSSVLYSPLAGGLTLLSMNPYSGRYHQTRAHCAFGLRAPMVGDPVYYQMSNELSTVSDFKVKYHSAEARRERAELLGAQPRLHLHSRQLTIKTFAGKEVTVTAPLPTHMSTTFHALGWSAWLRRAERRAALESAWRAEEDPHVIEALAQARIEHERHENGPTTPGGSAGSAAPATAQEEEEEQEPTEPSVPEPDSSIEFPASPRGRRSRRKT